MIKAKLSHLGISPRKVRVAVDLIRGLNVVEAEKQLKFLVKRAARPVLKLLNSAVANARDTAGLDKENLYIAKIVVDAGPTSKRWMPRAMGRATPIMKRTSHITIFLESSQPDGVRIKKKPVKKEKEVEADKKAVKPLEPAGRITEEKGIDRTKQVKPIRPYPTSSQSKKRFFSRQTFGNAKKIFRRKSI